jgi:hypothetical protein
MGHPEIISLCEVHARKQWSPLRRDLHEPFDHWLDTLEQQGENLPTTLAEVSETVWGLRQSLTGGITEIVLAHAHAHERARQQVACGQCERVLPVQDHVGRTVETLVGPVELERPYFYCRPCRRGRYPLDEALGLAPGCKQFDVQKAAIKVATEVPYEEAHPLFHDLTGLAMSSERMPTGSNAVAEGLTIVAVAPSRDEMERRIAQVAADRFRRPVLVLGIDGAYVPPRPASARGRRPGQGRCRARRARWQGQWREAKGWRFSLLDGERIVHVLSWPQVPTDQQLGEALAAVKAAGLIPEAQVRLCVVADGAEWIWKQVQAVFPQARQVLDYYHCSQYIHTLAQAQYGASSQGVTWADAPLTRLYLGQMSAVLGGLKRMKPRSEEAAPALANGWAYLNAHRGRTHYRHLRRGGYPLGSGGIESSNKFICHVRLKRSGAWWYERNSNQMLALRCAKYNGTRDQVFTRYQQRLRGSSE